MIDICQWRVSIGLWYSHQVSYSTIRNTNSTNGTVHSQSVVESGKSTFPAVVFVLLLLILSGDIELNPGPKTGNYHVIHCFYCYILELTSTNALRLLVKNGFDVEKKWSKLLCLLSVPLMNIKTAHGYHFTLEEGLQWWINNGTNVSWIELISAIEDCGDSNIATVIKREIGIGK